MDTTPTAPSQMAEYILAHFPRNLLDTWHISPDIPSRKIEAAMRTYVRRARPTIMSQDILVLRDDTLFHTGKKGLVVTEEGMTLSSPEDGTWGVQPIFLGFESILEVLRVNVCTIRFRTSEKGWLGWPGVITPDADKLQTFLRGLFDRVRAKEHAPSPMPEPTCDLATLIERTASDTDANQWVVSAMLEILRRRQQRGEFISFACVGLAQRTLALPSSRFRKTDTAKIAPTVTAFDLSSLLPLQVVADIIGAFMPFIPPPAMESEIGEKKATFRLNIEADTLRQRFAKGFAGLLFGQIIGGYWGAILGADVGLTSVIRKNITLSTTVDKEGDMTKVHIESQPGHLGKAIKESLMLAEQMACLGYALGVCSWPPSDSQAIPSEKEMAARTSHLLGSSREAEILLQPLGLDRTVFGE